MPSLVPAGILPGISDGIPKEIQFRISLEICGSAAGIHSKIPSGIPSENTTSVPSEITPGISAVFRPGFFLDLLQKFLQSFLLYFFPSGIIQAFHPKFGSPFFDFSRNFSRESSMNSFRESLMYLFQDFTGNSSWNFCRLFEILSDVNYAIPPEVFIEFLMEFLHKFVIKSLQDFLDELFKQF